MWKRKATGLDDILAYFFFKGDESLKVPITYNINNRLQTTKWSTSGQVPDKFKTATAQGDPLFKKNSKLELVNYTAANPYPPSGLKNSRRNGVLSVRELPIRKEMDL